MTACGDHSGQKWWAEKTEHGQARLKNMFSGSGMCLDVANDELDNCVRMAACGNHSGQPWWAQPMAPGYVRLKNAFTGSGTCLDIINDGVNNRLKLAACGDYSGQMWSNWPPQLGRRQGFLHGLILRHCRAGSHEPQTIRLGQSVSQRIHENLMAAALGGFSFVARFGIAGLDESR
jgi:hypothetical protein